MATSVFIYLHLHFAFLTDCNECWTPTILVSLINISTIFVVANVWGVCRMIVPKHLRAIAIGITNGVQSIGLSIAPLAIGIILDSNLDKKKGYI